MAIATNSLGLLNAGWVLPHSQSGADWPLLQWTDVPVALASPALPPRTPHKVLYYQVSNNSAHNSNLAQGSTS